MNTLKYEVTGKGSVANHYIKSIMDLNLCELVAVCSRYGSKLTDLKSKYEIETFNDNQEMLTRPNIDVFSIGTHSGFHLEPIPKTRTGA